MPTKKTVASKKAPAKKTAAKNAAPVAKKVVAKKAPQPVAAVATFRTKIDLANVAVGAKTVKQLARAVAKLAQTLARMDESGAVKLEQPVTAKGAHLATTDVKAAKRFGMQEGRAPRSAKTADPAAKKTAAVKAAEPLAAAPAKKAAAKKAAAKKTRAQPAADTAAVGEADDAAAPAAKTRAAKKASAKKASAKKAARKTGKVNGSNEPARAADGASAVAPEAPPATDTPGAEAAAS